MKLGNKLTFGKLFIAVSFFTGVAAFSSTFINDIINNSNHIERTTKNAAHEEHECVFDLENGSFTHYDYVAKSCTTPGNQEYYLCDDCGKVYNGEGIETTIEDLTIPAGHVCAYYEEVEATCTTTGIIEHYECEACHSLFDSEFNDITSADLIIPVHHNFVYYAGVEATCYTPGYRKIQYCEDCHIYYDEVSNLYGNAGWYDYWKRSYGITYAEHVKGSEIVAIDQWHHYYSCTVCGTNIGISHSTAVPSTYSCDDVRFCDECGFDMRHEFAEAIRVPYKNATCTEAGHTEYDMCGRCGDAITPYEVLEQIEHSFTKLYDYFDSTCCNIGYLETYRCDYCLKLFNSEFEETSYEDLVIEKKNHTLVHITAKDATCDTNGNVEMLQCSTCNLCFDLSLNQIDNPYIPATGHNLTIIPGVEAACSTSGYRDIGYCDICNKYVDPLSGETGGEGWYDYWKRSNGMLYEHHNYGSEIVSIGFYGHAYACIDCGMLINYSHNTSSIQDFDCSTHEYCDVCGFDMRHYGAQYHEVYGQDATCINQGFSNYYVCERCGENITEPEVLDYTDHNIEILHGYDSTCYSTGLTEGKRCYVCGETIVAQEVIDLKPHSGSEYYPILENDWRYIHANEFAVIDSHTLVYYPADFLFKVTIKTVDACEIPSGYYFNGSYNGQKYFDLKPGDIISFEAINNFAGSETIKYFSINTLNFADCIQLGNVLCEQDGNVYYDYNIYPSVTNLIISFNVQSNLQFGYLGMSFNMRYRSHASSTFTCGGTTQVFLNNMCDVCGRTYSIESKEVSIEDHALIFFKGTATCFEAGTIDYYYCSICGKYFNSDLEEIYSTQTTIDHPLEHDFSGLEYAYCEPSCSSQGTKSSIMCTRCSWYYIFDEDVVSLTNVIETLPHTYVHHDRTDSCPGLGNGMEEHYTCSVCNQYFNSSYFSTSKQSLEYYNYNHSYDYSNYYFDVYSSCDCEGKYAYYLCDICNKYIRAFDNLVVSGPDDPELTISKLEHSVYSIDSREPTCLGEGNILCYYCYNCGKYYVYDENYEMVEIDFDTEFILPKLDHILTYIPEVDANCYQTGVKEHYYCSSCNYYYSDPEGTDQIDVYSWSQWGDGRINYKHTHPEYRIESPYYHVVYCSDCGSYYSEDHVYEEDFDKYDYNNYQCSIPHECTICGFVNSHGLSFYSEDTEQSCLLGGTRTDYYCSYCGELYLSTNRGLSEHEYYNIEIGDEFFFNIDFDHAIIDGSKVILADENICITLESCDPERSIIDFDAKTFLIKEGDFITIEVNFGDYFDFEMDRLYLGSNCDFDLEIIFDEDEESEDEDDIEPYGDDEEDLWTVDNPIVKGIILEDLSFDKILFRYYFSKDDGILVHPTCTEDGYFKPYQLCDYCSEFHIGEAIIIPALGHSMSSLIEEVTPTCSSTGFKAHYVCETCGEFYDEEMNKVEESELIISKLSHTEVIDEAVEATCTTTGLSEGSHCSVCDEVIIEQTIIEKSSHTLVIDEAVPATCTTTGLTIGAHCSSCNEVIVEQQEVAVLGHNEVIDEAVPATCTITGLTEGSHCSVCGEVIIEQTIIEKLNHTVVTDEAVEATCTTTGLTEGSHCSVCDEVIVAQVQTEKLEHTIVNDEAVEATCSSTGLSEGLHCSVCGEVITPQEIVEKLSHTLVVDEAVPATCTSTGLTSGAHCSTCNEVIVAQQEVAVLGHNEVIDEAVLATCSTTGLTEGSHCSVCGGVIVEQEVINKLSHTLVVDEAVSATCSTTGLTEGSHCSVCNEILVAQVQTEKLEHTIFSDEAVAATCTNTGLSEGSHCSVCGEIIIPQQEVAALGHSLERVEAVEATCSSIGQSLHYECTICGDKFLDEEGNAKVSSSQLFLGLGEHKDSNQNGYCNICNILLCNHPLASLQHIDEVDATEDEYGVRGYYHCSICGLDFEDESTENVIGNIETWKNHLGRIDKIVDGVVLPPTTTPSKEKAKMSFGIAVLAAGTLGFASLFVALIILKKKGAI